jgi:ubiquitin-conjugating enzyme E2 A
MSTVARRKLVKDYKNIQTDKPHGVTANPSEQIMVWDSLIYGAEDSIWEGAIFRLSLEFTEEYPNKPPEIIFRSPIFHPNVYLDGKICLDILQNKWSSLYDVSAILISIRSLLTDPNPDSPANTEAAKLYTQDRKAYERRVRAIVEETWKLQ